MIATPTSLIALLRTVAFTWRQERLSASAAEIHALGRELHGRLGTVAHHLSRLGDGLENAVTSYNQAVRSVETRVLVTARRFADLGVAPDSPAAARTDRRRQAAEPSTPSRPRCRPRRITARRARDATVDR